MGIIKNWRRKFFNLRNEKEATLKVGVVVYEVNTKKYDVLLSYSHTDKRIAFEVCTTLEKHGIQCWIAPRDINPGTEWAAAIANAIPASRVFILILTQSSNQSRQVANEVERAVHYGLIIIPFRIEEVMPSKSLELHIGSSQWLDAMSPPIEKHFKSLVDLVCKFVNIKPPASSEGFTNIENSTNIVSQQRMDNNSCKSSYIKADISKEIDQLTELWFCAEDEDMKLREGKRLLDKLDSALAIIKAKERGYEVLQFEIRSLINSKKEVVLERISSQETQLRTFPAALSVDSPLLYMAKKEVKHRILILKDDLALLDGIIDKLQLVL